METMPGSMTEPQAIAADDAALNDHIPFKKEARFPKAQTPDLGTPLRAEQPLPETWTVFTGCRTLGLRPTAALKPEILHLTEAPDLMECVSAAAQPEALHGPWPETTE
ncbi:MAG: hypothetical protein M1840_005006 [Geoglossum simile]|nr:MAG: hypothetical protein M1840_005006 [Geoglossum simile]